MGGIISFNGQNSDSFGIIIERCPYPNKPVRRGAIFQIPGRNGNLVIEDGTYENVTRKFNVYFLTEPGGNGVYDRSSTIAQ